MWFYSKRLCLVFSPSVLVLSDIIKIVSNPEARLVINLRLYKNMEQKMRNEAIRIYPKFKIFNCMFFEYNGSSFFVKFVTAFNVLVLVLA